MKRPPYKPAATGLPEDVAANTAAFLTLLKAWQACDERTRRHFFDVLKQFGLNHFTQGAEE